jgi:hypothetical protein
MVVNVLPEINKNGYIQMYPSENIIFITSADPFLHIQCIIFTYVYESIIGNPHNSVHFIGQEKEILARTTTPDREWFTIICQNFIIQHSID